MSGITNRYRPRRTVVSVDLSDIRDHFPYPSEYRPTPAYLPIPDTLTHNYNARFIEIPSRKWAALSEREQRLIRDELEATFFHSAAAGLREMEVYRRHWHPYKVPFVGKVVKSHSTIDFFNKEVMIYIDTTAMGHGDLASLGRYFHRAWLHLHNERPPFQRGGFIAKVMQMTDRDEGALPRLKDLHQKLSVKLNNQQHDRVRFHNLGPWELKHLRPPPSPEVQSFRDRGYRLRPLFQALYLVFDHHSPNGSLDPWPPVTDGRYPFHFQQIFSHRISSQTVLLVRTGDETSLSSLISFLPLYETGLALDVDREGYSDDHIVRVKLDVAIQFIWDLLQREERCNADISRAADELRDEQDQFCQEWVEDVISCCQKDGLDEYDEPWRATRRALARRENEAFDMDQIIPWDELLDRWE
ncbi:hypothetical protein FAVG1_10236 [Fusarium avenaceum]|nr:hypothetical protein FAVG1_10236 [Fusarium avenaceum]